MGTTELDILDNYDVIQLSLTGLSGVVRKVNISSQKLKDILRNSGCVHFGNSVSNARSALIYDGKSCSGAANVDLSTLRELPWLSSQNGQRVGSALCQIASPAHQPSVVCSPRAAALKQVKRLKEDFGLIVMSAFEAEFMIFEKDGITPFNNVLIEPYGRADNMSGREAILLGTCSMMDKAGLPLESFMTEFAAAQFELTFRPEEGVTSADTITIMKDALRSCLSQNDMAVTFMACPLEEGHANGFHFNHSLWTSDGQNALLDSDDPLFMSDTARHWIAGLIHHAPALTALLCPTINCYRRLADEMCPKLATWGVENRRSYLRIKTDKKNVYIENRLPSSASNTYLDVAAILAAGLDGLERKLPCPAQSDTSSPLIPRKPEESLSALDEDDILRQAIGEDLVKGFIEMAKRGLSARVDGSDTLAFQRDVYFHAV